MAAPFPAYEGDGPYVFVSYAHADAKRIYSELAFLRESGINVWYDEGITPGSRWSDELANAIDQAELFLVFLTDSSVRSENCLNEMDFALRRRRPFLAVELEPVSLPPGIELNIGNRQSILAHRFTQTDYRTRLIDAITRSKSGERSTRGGGLAHAPQAFEQSPARTRVFKSLLVSTIVVTGLLLLAFFLARGEPVPDVRTTLAVLPFNNLSRDPDYDYLSEGLADELITNLGSVQTLSVSSRTSSFFYRDQAPRMQDIRERLGVGHAVEGSLRSGADGLVINVSLFETIQGRQIWTRQFAAPAKEISRLGAEIAMSIALELDPDADLAAIDPARRPDVSAAAYESYLKGLDFLTRPPTPETLDAASLFFRSSLEQQPDFARASAALCETHLTYYRMARTEDVQTHYDNAVLQCEAAIELDATHWAGRQSLATLYRVSGRFQDALREIRLADTLHPDTASIQYEYGKILAGLGEPERSEQKLRRGIALDPGFWGGYADLGDHLYLMGRYEEALAQFQKAVELWPDNDLMAVSLGATYYMLNRPQEAHQAWKRAIRENPESQSRSFWQSATWLGINSLNSGCPEEAAYWQVQAINISGSDHRLWGRLAESCQLQQPDYSAPEGITVQVYERAVELAEEELNANPNEWETLGLLAVYHARLGRGDSSLPLITQMLQMQPDNPDALETAMQFYLQQDDERMVAELQKRLLALNFPPDLLERNPFIGGRKACSVESNEKERLICAQGRIIPALRN